MPEYGALSAASCLSELCALFDLKLPASSTDIQSTSKTLKEFRKKREVEGGGGCVVAGSGDDDDGVSEKGPTKKTKIDMREGSSSDCGSPTGGSLALDVLPATDLR